MLGKNIIILGIVSVSACSSPMVVEKLGSPELVCGAKPTIGCLDGDSDVVKCANDCVKDKVFLQQPTELPRVINTDDMEKKINKNYPDWYRGNTPGGLADKDSHHYYYTLIGPNLAPEGVNAENIFCASYFLKPGKTYPAHSHPSREFYFIFGGEARWQAGDKAFDVKAGSFIMHPPFVAHGMTNTSKTELLSAVTCWWHEPGDPEDIFSQGGRMKNPCLVQSPKTAVRHKIPLSQCQSSPVVEEKSVTTKKTKD